MMMPAQVGALGSLMGGAMTTGTIDAREHLLRAADELCGQIGEEAMGQLRLAIAASVPADAQLDPKRLLQEPDRRARIAERDRLIREIAAPLLATLSIRQVADEIACTLRRYAGGEYRHDRARTEAEVRARYPGNPDRLRLWLILRAYDGRLLGSKRIADVLRALR
jgi:hypothetical protein